MADFPVPEHRLPRFGWTQTGGVLKSETMPKGRNQRATPEEIVFRDTDEQYCRLRVKRVMAEVSDGDTRLRVIETAKGNYFYISEQKGQEPYCCWKPSIEELAAEEIPSSLLDCELLRKLGLLEKHVEEI